MLLVKFVIFFIAQKLCQAEFDRLVDTSLPATQIGIYLKSLVQKELGFEHLQDITNDFSKANGVTSYRFVCFDKQNPNM